MTPLRAQLEKELRSNFVQEVLNDNDLELVVSLVEKVVDRQSRDSQARKPRWPDEIWAEWDSQFPSRPAFPRRPLTPHIVAELENDGFEFRRYVPADEPRSESEGER